jgi:hypothetical protein
MNQICAPANIKWVKCYSVNISQYYSKIEAYIAKGIPVMIQTTKYGMHYVVVIGRRASGNWDIFDPWDGQRHIMTKDGITKSMITKIYFFDRM